MVDDVWWVASGQAYAVDEWREHVEVEYDEEWQAYLTRSQCRLCGAEGHWGNECPKLTEQMCRKRGRVGHSVGECP